MTVALLRVERVKGREPDPGDAPALHALYPQPHAALLDRLTDLGNMAERVEGLISAVKPEIIVSGLAKRIEEIEKQYEELSLEVALVIADEAARRKFVTFDSKKEAMAVGIRTGFA